MITRKLSPSMQLALVFLLFGTIWIMLTDSISDSLIAKNDLAILVGPFPDL